MKPRNVTEADLATWGGKLIVMNPPTGMESNVEPLTAILGSDGRICSPWIIDDRDTEWGEGYRKTVWLSCWGGMVPTDIVIMDTPLEEMG